MHLYTQHKAEVVCSFLRSNSSVTNDDHAPLRFTDMTTKSSSSDLFVNKRTFLCVFSFRNSTREIYALCGFFPRNNQVKFLKCSNDFLWISHQLHAWRGRPTLTHNLFCAPGILRTRVQGALVIRPFGWVRVCPQRTLWIRPWSAPWRGKVGQFGRRFGAENNRESPCEAGAFKSVTALVSGVDPESSQGRRLKQAKPSSG